MGSDPSKVAVSGPMASHVEGFAASLSGQGYPPGSVARHLRLLAHVSRWLHGQSLGAAAFDPEAAEAFLADRRDAGYSGELTPGSLAPLLAYLRAAGAVPDCAPSRPASPVDVVLARYAGYLAAERGLAATTIARNVGLVAPFLAEHVVDGCLDLAGLRAAQVTAFVVDLAGRQPKSVARTGTALRSFLRFLHADEGNAAGLAAAVPAVAGRKLAGLPKALTDVQVTAMLRSCDRDTVVGRRDLAVLTVLSRLGLRAGEVAALSLDDIDWRRAEITLAGKGGRHDRLPIPADVGDAVVSYLRDGRPATDRRAVFISSRAPLRAMTRGSVTQVVARAADKAGLGTVYAHRLRHSAATAILAAGGSLAEIGQVLRHRDALTTAIYAKVDIVALRTVARSWPGTGAVA